MPNSYSLTLTLLLAIITFFTTLAQVNSETVVDAGILGRIQGEVVSTIGSSSRAYAQFLGIRYGPEPQRFTPSELFEAPLNSNGTTFEATKFGNECPQPSGSGNEDCLFLNVFTPQVTNSSVKYPVLVFIHGAAFVSGNANMYTGARLLNKDVVVISFNYRLGVFGFYNMEMTDAPGNAALYDALTVLRWVQKFVHHFSGDPSQVTLAASGSALDVWATSADPLTASLQVAGYVGCMNDTNLDNFNKTVVLDCMLNATQAHLSTGQNVYQYMDMVAGGIGFAAVSPSVQKGLPVDFPLIVPEHPVTVLESGTQNNVSLMMGVTRDDGGFALRLVLEGYITPHKLNNDTTFMRDRLVPTIFQAFGIEDPANTVSDTFRNIYMEEVAGQSGDFNEMVPSLMDMLGVLFFKSAAYKSAQYHSKITSDTYYYSFDYEGNYTRHPPNAGFPGGVAHADDLQYVFQLTDQLNKEDQVISDIMVEYWVNFVQTGNPNKKLDDTSTLPSWPEIGDPAHHYLTIDSITIASRDYRNSWVIENRKDLTCQNSATSLNPVLFVPLSVVMIAFTGKL